MKQKLDTNAYNFIKESNKIEGITREPSFEEIDEFYRFLGLAKITVSDVEKFVKVYQSNAVLRVGYGLNVRVGDYYPPKGGPEIKGRLESLLVLVNDGANPFDMHREYESLHPFTDGNGRSGRMIWAWQMVNQKMINQRKSIDGFGLDLGFLHAWYYQSLKYSR